MFHLEHISSRSTLPSTFLMHNSLQLTVLAVVLVLELELELELVVGAAVVEVTVVVVLSSVVVVAVGVVLPTLLPMGVEAAVPVPEPVSNSTESGEDANVGLRLSANPTGPRSAASAISGQLSSSGCME